MRQCVITLHEPFGKTRWGSKQSKINLSQGDKDLKQGGGGH